MTAFAIFSNLKNVLRYSRNKLSFEECRVLSESHKIHICGLSL